MKNADIRFQDRDEALAEICAVADQPLVLNVYGEGGIGKSRLLTEAKQRLWGNSPSSLVFYIDLGDIPTSRPETLLRKLIADAQGLLNVSGRDVTQIAGQIVTQLRILAESRPVHLMFDTTEKFQENMDFWGWMEANLVGPIVIEGRVQQVFAGRVPVPWRRVEVRRIVKLLPLEPLSVETDARNLAQDVLQRNKALHEDATSLKQAVDLVLEFSFGHPALAETLSAYIASQWSPASLPEFRNVICNEVVKPFIEAHFLKDIDYPWDEILWWASALDWFDPTILQRYLKLVDPALTKNQPDYFFIQGISRLRIQHTIIWREERGDRLHGVVAKIMRHCLEVQDPERYRQACRAGAETLENLAKEFPEPSVEYPEAEQYRQEAQVYRQRAKEEVEYGQ